jgi:enoyl-CoA hydratase/carnithine racemase
MTYRTILFETPEPAIARITLNRPDRMNAYTNAMCDEIMNALHAYIEDDALRCLILTGAGRGFCSGGDVAGAPVEGEAKGPSYRNRQMGFGQEMRAGMHRVIATLHRMDKPVIAAINGAAVAGGLTLALACDFRIAADTAKLGDTAGKFALLPDEGGAWFFPRVMGLDRALKNMMRKGLDSSLENSLDDAALSVMIANPSQDVREGVAAFFAKRAPKFEGR